MSRNVLRLLLDHSPMRWIVTVFALLVLVVIDAIWIGAPAAQQAVTLFMTPWAAFMPSLMYAGKFPAWRILPLTSRERTRAQWWVWIGLPAAWMIATMAGVASAFAWFGRMRADPIEIPAALGGQLTAAAALAGAAVLSRLLRRRLGGWSALVFIAAMLAVAVGLARLRDLDPRPLMAAGAATLVLAGLAYLNAARLTLWLERVPLSAPKMSAPKMSAPAGPRGAERAGWGRGWLATAPWALPVAAFTILGAVVIVCSPTVLVGRADAESVRGAMSSQPALAVLVMSIIVGAPMGQAIRALRALPIGPAGLTFVLQGFMLTVAALSFAAIWAVFEAAGIDTARIPFLLFAAIVITALRLPLAFRLAAGWSVLASAAPILLIAFLRFLPWSDSPVFDVLALALTAALWVWTWWELAYGRGAYRPPHPALTRWRGGT